MMPSLEHVPTGHKGREVQAVWAHTKRCAPHVLCVAAHISELLKNAVVLRGIRI